VVSLEALCALWFLKTCPIIRLATRLPVEAICCSGVRTRSRMTSRPSIDPGLLQLAKKVVAHGLAQVGAVDFRPTCGDRLDDEAYEPGLPYSA
jgi:hypothetical protein